MYTSVHVGMNQCDEYSLARRSNQMKALWYSGHSTSQKTLLKGENQYYSSFTSVLAHFYRQHEQQSLPLQVFIDAVISLQTLQKHLTLPKFGLFNFPRYPQDYYNNCSHNITCCITTIESFRHAYIMNPVNTLVLAFRPLA